MRGSTKFGLYAVIAAAGAYAAASQYGWYGLKPLIGPGGTVQTASANVAPNAAPNAAPGQKGPGGPAAAPGVTVSKPHQRQVTEWDEPQAVIGSYLHRYAYPSRFEEHAAKNHELQTSSKG